jgi:transcriptional regulator
MEQHLMETRTIRQQIFILLQQERLGAKEISQALGLPEKEVYKHLEHIARTARRQGYRLEIEPEAACLACGFTFKARQRLTPPGRCPCCRATHLSEPLFHLVQA